MNPNAATELTMKCVLIYLGQTKTDWPSAQKVMADIKFLDRLKTYDKTDINQGIIKKVKDIVTDKQNFSIDKITKSSQAAGGLARWCQAVFKYSEAMKIVVPLQQQVAEM